MVRTISPQKAEEIIREYTPWIREVSGKYQVPEAVIKAILFREMTESDILDPLVDLLVQTQMTSKKDSSTGYAQIFGVTGLRAVEYAVDSGIATYESLGIQTDHRLSDQSEEDIHMIWRRLHDDPKFNIEAAAINLRCCAQEMTGRTDFGSFSEEEMKKTLTRYNANVAHITAYGEETYRLMLAYAEENTNV